MDLFNQFASNETLEVEGTKCPLGDSYLLVAREGNKAYRKVMSKLYEKNRALLDKKNEAAEELAEEIMIEAMATTILLGWGDSMQFNGKPFPYTVENAQTALRMRDFRELVNGFSRDFENYRLVQEKAALGN
jgi:hypothetical protein